MRTETELRESIDYLADEAPQGDELLRSLWQTRQARRGRIVRSATVLVVAAVAIVAMVMAVRVLTPHAVQPADPAPSVPGNQRVFGNWSMISTVTAPAGWRITQRSIDRETESTVLKPTSGTNNEAQCMITLEGPGSDFVTTPNGNRTTLAGQRGFYRPAQGDEKHSADFFWTYADQLYAVADCVSVADPKALLTSLVGSFRLTTTPVSLPFELTAVPTGYEVTAVRSGAETGVSVDQHGDSSPADATRVDLADTEGLDALNSPARPENLGGNSVLTGTTRNGTEPKICIAGRPTICAARDEGDNRPAGQEALVRALMTNLRPAADLSDPSSWPYASDLPR